MSKLRSTENIKIPYATEGIVRTAALDDTIAPEDSVQLAVNMNFDRVGAIQTRPGVTNYADSITEQINNFGVLKNRILSDGYDSIEQVGVTNAIVTTLFLNPTAVKVSDTKIAVFWTGVDNDGFCRNFSVNPVTGAMTAIGNLVEFEIASYQDGKGILIGTTQRVLLAWRGVDNDGFVQTFDCAGDTINPLSVALEFDITWASSISLAAINGLNFICFYANNTSVQGIATVFQVNAGTGAVTQPGSSLVFEAGGSNFNNHCAALGDGTRFINAWEGGNPTVTKTQMFSVNLTTWAITALSASFTPVNAFETGPVFPIGDGSRFMSFGLAIGGPTGYSARVLRADLTTYALTQVGATVNFQNSGGNGLFGVSFGDGQNFAAFYTENVGFGFVQLIRMNPSTYAITLTQPRLAGYNFSNLGSAPVLMSPTKVFINWANPNVRGESAMLQTFGPLTNGKWLYAGHSDKISNADNQAWTVRRSGLAQVSKPRFAQYLNYIWMVNGNQRLGGDPVATSKGEAFGTDLVPANFPKGDFIHAGFEGRVWVVDRALGVIHYTDIVQFSPPDNYTLTYNPTVNFISNLSPQTGDIFTALYRVPRALLVFTENSIFRIYGAASVDAYPAYNVGTFSQESIIESKTGIFFHHSSGFYQFDYGSQPVEISRKIIDFVKAIPRSAYGDIKGVYDGFDAVEWAVGQVVVEGVVFSNCVLRYTLSTQVWTVYDYTGNVITAMISYDNGIAINHLIGTSTGLVGALDTGNTDFGQPFYYEFIDRWRSFTEMYCEIKSLDGINVYSENAAGANLTYQIQKSGPNAWLPLMTVTDKNNSLEPNVHTEDFDVVRLRLAGNTRGAQVVVHGIEVKSLMIKGVNKN